MKLAIAFISILLVGCSAPKPKAHRAVNVAAIMPPMVSAARIATAIAPLPHKYPPHPYVHPPAYPMGVHMIFDDPSPWQYTWQLQASEDMVNWQPVQEFVVITKTNLDYFEPMTSVCKFYRLENTN